jgi:hypothetical protein
MKKLLSVLFISTVIILTSCGPAAEDRVQMDRIAKRMSDSIFNLVDSSLKEPGKIVDLTAQPMQQPVAQPQPTAAATPTTK